MSNYEHRWKDKSHPPIHYAVYRMSVIEKAIYAGLASTVCFLLGFIFFKLAAVSVFLALLGLFYPVMRCKQLAEKRKQELRRQFRHALYSLSSCLIAGKSVENALKESVQDLRLLYANPTTYMIQEMELINRRIQNGEPVESAFRDFAERSGVDDIENFTEVFATCKRTGGDLVEVIRRTTSLIGDKIEIQQEIYVMLAQKRFESHLLSFIPVIITAFLSFSSPEYMSPLYEGIGHIIMGGALLLLTACFLLAKKIMDIKV
jgi:tight adherence protein B